MTVPFGYRFLIQLVDAKTEVEVAQFLTVAYGCKCAKVAVIQRGCEKLKARVGGAMIFETKATGFTVYVPKEFRLP